MKVLQSIKSLKGLDMIERGLEGLLVGIMRQRRINEPTNGHSVPGHVTQIQLPGDTFSLSAFIPLSDEEIMLIDPVVSEVHRNNKDAFLILDERYGRDKEDVDIARDCIFTGGKRNSEWVRNVRTDTVDWIAKRLGIPDY